MEIANLRSGTYFSEWLLRKVVTWDLTIAPNSIIGNTQFATLRTKALINYFPFAVDFIRPMRLKPSDHRKHFLTTESFPPSGHVGLFSWTTVHNHINKSEQWMMPGMTCAVERRRSNSAARSKLPPIGITFRVGSMTVRTVLLV
jgi:hypothetical protein